MPVHIGESAASLFPSRQHAAQRHTFVTGRLLQLGPQIAWKRTLQLDVVEHEVWWRGRIPAQQASSPSGWPVQCNRAPSQILFCRAKQKRTLKSLALVTFSCFWNWP